MSINRVPVLNTGRFNGEKCDCGKLKHRNLFYSDNLKERVFERLGNGEPKQSTGITILSFLRA